MPYIKQQLRQAVRATGPETPGELNYLITLLVQAYIEQRGESYQTYNDAVGALESAKLELYRRKIAPYEDQKIQENGDVY